MITEEEICHQNNNFLNLLHPSNPAVFMKIMHIKGAALVCVVHCVIVYMEQVFWIYKHGVADTAVIRRFHFNFYWTFSSFWGLNPYNWGGL